VITSTPDRLEQFVGGKKLLTAFGGSVLAAAAVGTVGYFVFHALLGNAWGTTVAQIVTLQVYMVLLITLASNFARSQNHQSHCGHRVRNTQSLA
jgi:hypothetical protein